LAQTGEPTRGPTPDEVAQSRQRVDEADASMLRAIESSAQAHDRAADLHESRAASGATAEAVEGHAQRARVHRDAAAADRELARHPHHHGEPPAG
jgi:hypothetical protein